MYLYPVDGNQYVKFDAGHFLHVCASRSLLTHRAIHEFPNKSVSMMQKKKKARTWPGSEER
jgi:hypothetical protein